MKVLLLKKNRCAATRAEQKMCGRNIWPREYAKHTFVLKYENSPITYDIKKAAHQEYPLRRLSPDYDETTVIVLCRSYKNLGVKYEDYFNIILFCRIDLETCSFP